MEVGTTRLYRGEHELPHMSQVLRRDLRAETVRKHFGQTQSGWRLSPDRARALYEGTVPGRGMARPYQFLIYAAGAIGYTSDTAFETPEELCAWMEAYGITFANGHVPQEADAPFTLQLPGDDAGFGPLTERER